MKLYTRIKPDHLARVLDKKEDELGEYWVSDDYTDLVERGSSVHDVIAKGAKLVYAKKVNEELTRLNEDHIVSDWRHQMV